MIGAWLLLLGLGIGCALEILVLVVQNAVRPDQVGAATGGNSFFREIGVTLGTALVGTLFTTRLTARLCRNPFRAPARTRAGDGGLPRLPGRRSSACSSRCWS